MTHDDLTKTLRDCDAHASFSTTPPQSDWMHPECFEAMQSMDYYDLDQGWTPGDFERGKTE
jgi:hypothetical protein